MGVSLLSVFLMASLYHRHCNEMFTVGVVPGEQAGRNHCLESRVTSLGFLILFRFYCCNLSTHFHQPLPRITVAGYLYLRHFLTSFNTPVLLTPGHANCFSRGHHHQSWAQKAAGGSQRRKGTPEQSLGRMEPFTFWFCLAMTFPPYVELPLPDARREDLAR